MEKFIGRRNELEKLESLYSSKGFQMAVIYGRRRVGKSTLITQFLKGKKAIYYVATKVGLERNINLLASQVLNTLRPKGKSLSLTTLEDIFSYIGNYSSTKKLVFVIDEFPYWAESDDSIISILQKYIDTEWKNKNILFLICGSALSFMESKVLSEKSPLFGRRTIQIKLEAFNYLESAEFFPNYSYEEKAICYGITGGIAQYLSLINERKSLYQNIIELFFDKTGYLYDETKNLLRQEFSEIVTINNVIETIALGTTTIKMIAEKVHINEANVLYCLERLINVGIIEKRHCILEERNKKKVQYVLKDQMFKFWYTFIANAVSMIEFGHGALYFNNIVKPQLHTFMGRIFEDMCKLFVLRKSITGELGCFITEVGSWWGVEHSTFDGVKQIQSADIDIVGISSTEKCIVVGECKFKNDEMDKSVLDTLVRRSKSIPSSYMISKYLLFSLSGFTNQLVTSTNDMVQKYTLEDLYKV